MEEDHKRETRRSRSKTPLTFLASVDRDVEIDGEKKKLKKAPAVETIVEESPVVVPTPRPNRAKRTSARVASENAEAAIKDTAALIANSVAVVPEAIHAAEQVVTKTTLVTTTTTKTVKKGGEQVEKQHTVEKQSKTSSSRAAATRESSQNESNILLEQNAKLKTSTPRSNKSITLNDISFTNGSTNSTTINAASGPNLEDHAAFKEYKEAGEYWNKFPKTDYTYSKLSQQRREIKPGVIAMPNMSRRSLENHSERVSAMIRRDPAQESFFRSRYEALTALRKRNAVDSYYDSQDETDLSFGINTSRTTRSFFRRVITTITSFFSTIFYFFTPSKRNASPYYGHYAAQQQGFFGRLWSRFSSIISAIFRRIYIIISAILFLDTWALKSSDGSGRKKKIFLLSLLVLLPALLFGAWVLSDESDKAFYRQRYSIGQLPTFNVPERVHGTFDEFTTRMSRIVPLAMAMLRKQTTNVTNKLKLLFDINWNWYPGLWHSHDIPQARVALTTDEYQRMIDHINAHIETIIDKKVQHIESNLRDSSTSTSSSSSSIDPKIAVFIANTIQEQIIHHKYELTDADIERIANIVHEKLLKSNAKPIPLTQATLEEISRLIQQKIELHYHEWNTNNNNGEKADDTPQQSNEKLDIQEILHKVLTSVELTNFIDKRFNSKAKILSTQLNDHQSSIDILRSDMNDLKEQLKAAFVINDANKISIEKFHSEQEKFRERLDTMDSNYSEQLKKLLATLESKSDTFNDGQLNVIDNHIRNILADIFGYRGENSGQPLTDADLMNRIQSIFVAKELLESRLFELNAKFDNRFADEINQMAEMIIGNVSQTIKRDIAVTLELNQAEQQSKQASNPNVSLDEAYIRKLIQKALATYDADKTGMVDYALESSGGEVLSTSNTPRSVISPTVQPGECWSFRGFPGYLVLKLSHFVHVTGFTMEHIPKSIAPDGIDSAPNSFTVWGLTSINENEAHHFGDYEFLENGESLQYFPVQNTDYQNARSHNIVELRIESNHGNNNYTCLYRFRVHGKLTTTVLS